MRQRVTEEQIRLAKSVDLISYMKQYEPQELIRTGPHDYKTTTHSSLCISDNGLWHWFSHGVGGRGALNYLIQVKGMDFVSAVRHLCELEHLTPVPFQQSQSGPPPQHERRPFTLPVPDKNAETALQYLKRRGIDSKILKYCIDQGILYQTTRGGYKNCVFVGRDTEGQPRSACVRGCQGTFRGECAGSEKQYGFCIPAGNETADIVEVYEAPIDALSGATLHLYYHYLYLFGKVQKRQTSSRKTHFLLWEDFRTFERYKQQAQFLWQNRIQTTDDLHQKRQEVTAKMDGLAARRQALYKLRSNTANGLNKADLSQQIQALTEELRGLRKELRYRWGKPLRGVGVRGASLVPQDCPIQLGFFSGEEKRERMERIDKAVDTLRQRYGYTAVQRAVLYTDRGLGTINPKDDHTVHPVGFFNAG